MIKVLHIIWSTNMGGIERLVLNLWKAQLQNPQLQPALYAGQPNGTLWKEFRQSGITYSGPFSSGHDLQPQKINEVTQLFKQFDVLHFHSFHPATAYAAVRSGKKIIYTEHGNFGFGRKLTLTDKINRSLLGKFLRNYVNFITYNSSFSKTTAEARYNTATKTNAVVYNGITIAANQQKSIDSDIASFIEGHTSLACIARLTDVKRIDRLIDAIQQCEKKSRIRLVLFGTGPLDNSLKSAVEKAGLNSSILFAGHRNDIQRYYPAFDAFILPSANEAFGLVVMEAYAAGRTTLVFKDGGGAAELVSQCEADMIAANPTHLALLIDQLIDSTQLNNSNSEEHRKQFAAKFSISNLQEQLFNIYQQV
jgi:glycosyltransferase involved in cell wall biosynthesis